MPLDNITFPLHTRQATGIRTVKEWLGDDMGELELRVLQPYFGTGSLHTD